MNIPELEAKIGALLHGVHEVQRTLSEAKVPTMAMYLNPRQQAMSALADAQKSLEDAEESIRTLADKLNTNG